MKLLSTKSILFFILLTLLATSQRGGGRSSSSRSRSRSTTRSSSRGGWFSGRRSRSGNYTRSGWGIFDTEQQRDGNETGTGENIQIKQDVGYILLVLIIIIFAGLGYAGYKADKQKKKLKKIEMQKIYTQFEAKAEANMCTFSDQQKIASKDWFMGNDWTISFRTNDLSFHDSAKVTLKNIESRSRYCYKIRMEIYDSIGRSQSEGVLLHQSDYFGILFDKLYINRSEAGQTDGFDMLIYEGVQQGQIFRGKWFYKGYQNQSQYSGTWQMSHL